MLEKYHMHEDFYSVFANSISASGPEASKRSLGTTFRPPNHTYLPKFLLVNFCKLLSMHTRMTSLVFKA